MMERLTAAQIMSCIPIQPQERINPEMEGDYYENGILMCGVCRKPKQKYIEPLGKVVPLPCECREKEQEEQRKRIEWLEKMGEMERLRQASMMSGQFANSTFKNYIKRDENKRAYNVAVNYCKNWAEMKANSQGLLFYGPCGTGKSWTAACIANYLLGKCVPVVMTSFVKILQDIRTADNEGRYLDTLNKADLLIIDDLGTERSTDYGLEKVYNAIDSRVRVCKPMILTTNTDLDEIQKATDIRYRRIYDRVLETCFPVEVAGKSFRVKEAKERFDNMRKLLDQEV